MTSTTIPRGLGKSGVLMCVALMWVAACSESRSPTAPTPAASVEPARPPGMTLQAWVFDTASRRLVGARVEALEGPGAGASALTGTDGTALLQGPFTMETRFRATSDGHEALTTTPQCSVANCARNAVPWLSFNLRPLAPAPDLAGEYLITLSAHSSCESLPPDARTRTYPATMTPVFRANTADLIGFNVALNSASVLEPRRLSISVAADFVSLYVYDRNYDDRPGLIEDLGDNHYLSFMAVARGTVTGSRPASFSLPLVGLIAVDASQCTSTQHLVTFQRR